MADTTKHSPPLDWWVDEEGCVASGHGDDYRTVTDAILPEDAAYIVLAVNHHAALREALEEAQAAVCVGRCGRLPSGEHHAACIKARAVLAALEGK